MRELRCIRHLTHWLASFPQISLSIFGPGEAGLLEIGGRYVCPEPSERTRDGSANTARSSGEESRLCCKVHP